ncbi:ubiquitination network signaling protein [Tolypocladium capitatum]|uniref:Ubiquitination network signaling protein n=1 Tax=Tolypocladium capitatum TaxID=45235 RepID=A0A2K3QIN7_9HYPO|nr:ubiquitination network signaling protein [Tolypocladium capitatum]
MPRASGPGKRQQAAAAGHRDSRHDNGPLGPGKRISGNKSHGHPEGSARAPDPGAGHAGPSPPPSTNGLLVNAVAGSKNHPDAAASGPDGRSSHALRRDSLGTYSETSSESSGSHMGPNGVDGGHRQIDVNAMKNVDVHRDSGPLELAATVVRSLPVQDTLAILIILMHIPYLSLSFVYLMFASLTFVPPVANRAGLNFNFGDMLDGNSHTPSLGTVMCMDFFFFLIWVFLWPPIQDFTLDFAKPVIAVTLGGGTNARDGTSRGVVACITWVLLHKLMRASKVYWPRVARHVPEAWRMPAVFGDSFYPTSAPYDKRDTHGWVQSVLAIHILTQGIVRYIREWYLRRERFNSTAGFGDPEAGKNAGSGGMSAVNGTSTTDSSHDAVFSTLDAEAGLPTVSNPATMAKKRRKQSAQVRLQQPLWAALASTKIVAIKEFELSSWGGGSSGSDKRDIHNSGNAPSFNRLPKQIWISYIGSDEVCFNTSHFPDADDESHVPVAPPAGVDTSKPFYVRINNAFWQPTRIFPVQESDECADGPRWTGDIYGLRPASKYVCEFVDARFDNVLFTTSIRTVKEPLREHDPMSPGLPDGQQPLRPDSPATTLRTSIAAAEAKLADERNRLKTWRKEWKTRTNALKKEIELADNQLSSAGNSDEKYKQKIRQQETQRTQAERDTERLSEQLKNFDTAPELSDRKKKAERAYSAEKKVFDAAQKQFKEHKSRLETEVKAKEVERSNLNTRRNKIATRIAKVENELANITDANNRGLDEAERRRQERVRWLEQVAAIENNYSERLGHVIATNNGRREHLGSLQAQLQALQGYLNTSNGLTIDINPTTIHEASHPSYQQSNLWNPNPAALLRYPGGPWAASSGDMLPPICAPSRPPSVSAWQTPPTAISFEPRGAKARGRSSSMLSDVSGFTEARDEGSRSPPARVHQRPQPSLVRGIRASGSSGSSGSGSVGDPPSPTYSPERTVVL